MKKSIILFIVFGLLYSITNAQSNQYPFGVYGDFYHGIYQNNHVPKNDVINFYKNNLSVNTFLFSVRGSKSLQDFEDLDIYYTAYGAGSGFFGPHKNLIDYFNTSLPGLNLPIAQSYQNFDHRDYSYSTHWLGSDLCNFERPSISALADGHYLKATDMKTTIPGPEEFGNFICLRETIPGLSVNAGSNEIINSGLTTVINSLPYENIFQIVPSEKNTIDGTYKNNHTIRPRTFNGTYDTEDKRDYKLANFSVFLDYDIINMDGLAPNKIIAHKLSTTSKGAKIKLILTDQVKYIDSINENLLDTTIDKTDGHYSDRFNFSLKYASKISPDNYETINSAFAIGLKLDLTVLSITKQTKIKINAIKIYDEVGRLVVEDDYFSDSYVAPSGTFKPFKFMEEYLNKVYEHADVNKVPIEHFADESMTGNNAVMAQMINSMFKSGSALSSALKSNLKIYLTQPEKNEDLYLRRLLIDLNAGCTENFNLDRIILAPDPYDFEVWDNTNYSTFVTNLIGPISINSKLQITQKAVNTIKETHSYGPTLYAVLQAHELDPLRMPSKNEILAETYLSFLNNYKGVLYFVLYTKDYEGIYKMPGVNLSHDQTFAYLSDTSHINKDHRQSIKPIGDKLNKTLYNEGKTLGKFLLDNNLQSIGFLSNLNSYATTITNIGNESTDISINSIELIDPTTGNVLPQSSEYLVGYASSYNVSTGVRYLYLANMNKDSKPIHLRIKAKTAVEKFLNVSDLSNLHIANRTYPAHATVLMALPADDFIVVKFVPTTGGSYGFSKSKNFGVIRKIGSSTRVILDRNFNSTPGVKEELDTLLIPGTSQIIEPVLYDPDNYTDINSFSYAIDSNKVKATFTIFKQNSNGKSFTKVVPSSSFYSNTYPAGSILSVQPYSVNYSTKKIGRLRGFAVTYISGSTKKVDLYEGSILKKTYSNNLNSILSSSSILKPYLYLLSTGLLEPVLSVFSNNYFYIDKDNNLSFGPDEAFGPWGDGAYPIVGDWSNDINGVTSKNSNYEYGVYLTDNFYASAFRLNFDGTTPYSWFEWSYGNPGDLPIIWQSAPPAIPINKTTNDEEKSLVNEIILNQNYPNPFNPNTSIRFNIPKREFVKISVFDILGREIAVLSNSILEPGLHEVSFNGIGLSSGVYFYKLQTESKDIVKKMILNK